MGGAVAFATPPRTVLTRSSRYLPAAATDGSGASPTGKPAFVTEPSLPRIAPQTCSQVRRERGDEQGGHLDEPGGEVRAHAGVAVALDPVCVSRRLQVVVPRLERLAEHHVLVVVLCARDGGVDGVGEHPVGEGGGRVGGAELTLRGRLSDGFDPLELLGEPENRRVGGVVDKVASSMPSPASAAANLMASALYSSMAVFNVLKLPVDLDIFSPLRSRCPLVRKPPATCSRRPPKSRCDCRWQT